jgi:hypothetical protein
MTYPPLHRIAWIMCCFLFLNITFLQSKSQRQYIQLNYGENTPVLTEKDKERAWHSYIKLNEGSWIYFDFVDTSESKWSITFSQKKALCKSLHEHLYLKGVTNSHIKIKYAPSASLVVYKESGKNIQANHFALNDQKAQVFMISNSEGAAYITKAGNKIEFPPTAFKCGVQDEIKIVLHEAISNNDFVRSGYTSTASGRLLESKGMYYIEAYSQGKKVSLRQGKNVVIKFSKTNFSKVNEAQLFHTFYGKEENKIINWQISRHEKVAINMGLQNLPRVNARQSISPVMIKDASYTDMFFVKLCSKIHLINPEIAAKTKKCLLTKRDYQQLITLYGNLNHLVLGQPLPLTSYSTYLAAAKINPDKLLIGLNDTQKGSYQTALLQEQITKSKQASLEKIEEFYDEATSEESRLAYQQRKAEEIKNFPVEMKISKLGHINCDRFNNGGKKTDVIVQLDEYDYDQIRVYVIFKDIKSVINGYYRIEHQGFIRFDKLPIGNQVTYLAATFKDDQVKLAYLSKKIEADEHIELSMTTYTRDQYQRILDDLIPD